MRDTSQSLPLRLAQVYYSDDNAALRQPDGPMTEAMPLRGSHSVLARLVSSIGLLEKRARILRTSPQPTADLEPNRRACTIYLGADDMNAAKAGPKGK